MVGVLMRKTAMIHRTCAGLIFIVAMMRVGYAESGVRSSVPARFVEDEQSLQNLIVFPDVVGDVILTVYCIANVNSGGQIERNYCFASEQGDQAFRDAVLMAGESASTTPAIVAGRTQPVHIRYRVVFVRKDDAAAIGVYPNWGRDVAKYGNKYEGPQRIRNTSYPSACRIGRAREVNIVTPVKSNYKTRAFFVLTSVNIDVAGTARKNVTFEWSEKKLTGQCPARIRYILEHAEYIPAHYGGEPVEATYLEPWGNYEAMQLN